MLTRIPRQLALAVVGRRRTFLARAEWMVKPWDAQARTWRDGLYDFAAQFSEVAAGELHDEFAQVSAVKDFTRRTQGLLSIDRDLGIWRQEWLGEEFPWLVIECASQCEPHSCICSTPAVAFPSSDFALLQVEYWSLQLLVSLEIPTLHSTHQGHDGAMNTPSLLPVFLARCASIARSLEEALALPVFGQSEAHFGGLTEGLCRTIMPSWILRQWKSQEALLKRMKSD